MPILHKKVTEGFNFNLSATLFRPQDVISRDDISVTRFGRLRCNEAVAAVFSSEVAPVV